MYVQHANIQRFCWLALHFPSTIFGKDLSSPLRPAPTNDSGPRPSTFQYPAWTHRWLLRQTKVQGSILSTANVGLEDSPIDYVMIYGGFQK